MKKGNISSSVLEKPIFMIGVPRSGTTIIFEALCRHELLGWLTNYSEEFPSLPALNLLRGLMDNRVFSVFGHKKQHNSTIPWNRYLPKPYESYAFWNYYARKSFAEDYLAGVKAEEAEAARVRNAVKKTVKYQGRRRFTTKLTGPGRIEYLNSIFPDAIFVHVIRDGRAVVDSLLRVPFWKDNGGYDHPFWKNGFPDYYFQEWERSGKQKAVLAALQWRNIIECSRKEATKLGQGRYHEIYYEDWVKDPVASVTKLLNYCELGASARVNRYVSKIQCLKNMNRYTYSTMSNEELLTVSQATQPLLGELGYEKNIE